MADLEKREKITESDSEVYQRALDLEAMGLMGITPDEKYRRELGVVFDSEEGNFESLPKGAKILDLACGRGDTTKMMQEKGYSVTGVDFSETAIADANQRFMGSGIDFRQGDMKQPPKTEGGYDAIACLGRSLAYFETYEEYTEALRNWHDALKDGGKVAIEWTEWDEGSTGGDWKSAGSTAVKTEPELSIVDEETGESLGYAPSADETFEYPGPRLEKPIPKHRGGRVYVDAEGKKHELGNQDTLFVDLLKKRNLPLLQRMLEGVGFTNIRLVESSRPLTPEGNFKTCRVFTLTAEKASTGVLIGDSRGKIGSLLTS